MSGNGVDPGAIYARSNEIKAFGLEFVEFKAEAVSEFWDARMEMKALKSDVRGLHGDTADLRQTLREHHGSVMGHGMHTTEHDERLTRLERRQA